MPTPRTLHVIAQGDAMVPYVDADGRPVRGRYAGRDVHGRPRAERVAATTYHQRAVDHGDLALFVEPAPAAPAAPTPTPPAPPVDAPLSDEEVN